MNKRILIDVGHGGSDPGAVNGNRLEKNDVLRMALKVGSKLSSAGHEVQYTRTTDCSLSLSARSYMCNNNEKGAFDYFVSFHRDSFTSASANGVTAYTYIGYSSKVDGKLGREISNRVAAEGNLFNRGVKEADFHVLRETVSTAVLLEIGFISNSDDNTKFDNRFDNIAKAIADGMCSVIGGTVTGGTQTPNPTTPQAKYRVKVSGKQIGAYSSLDNAKREADSRNGIVEDMAGNKVYPYNPDSTDEKYRYSEKGTFYPNTTIYFRDKPWVDSSNPIVDKYTDEESVNYDTVVIGEKYNWISWVSESSGIRRYMPIRDKQSNEPMWGYVV